MIFSNTNNEKLYGNINKTFKILQIIIFAIFLTLNNISRFILTIGNRMCSNIFGNISIMGSFWSLWSSTKQALGTGSSIIVFRSWYLYTLLDRLPGNKPKETLSFGNGKLTNIFLNQKHTFIIKIFYFCLIPQKVCHLFGY